jgi:hypothetical protein
MYHLSNDLVADFKILDLPPELRRKIIDKTSYEGMRGLVAASPMLSHMVKANMRRCVKDGLAKYFGEQGSSVVSISYDEILSLVGFESVSDWGPLLGRAHVKRVKEDWWTCPVGKGKQGTLLGIFLKALLPFELHFLKYAAENQFPLEDWEL